MSDCSCVIFQQRGKLVKKSPEELVNDIQEACSQLGWCIGLDESSSTVQGLVIGKLPFVEEVVGNLPDGDAYTVYAASAETSDKH